MIIFDFFGLTIHSFHRYLGHYDIYTIDDQQRKEGYHLRKSLFIKDACFVILVLFIAI